MDSREDLRLIALHDREKRGVVASIEAVHELGIDGGLSGAVGGLGRFLGSIMGSFHEHLVEENVISLP